MEALAEELGSGFEEFAIAIGKNTKQILKRSAELCTEYGLDSESFVDSWMAFAATGSIHELDEKNLEVFEKQELSKEKEKKASKSISMPVSVSTTVESKVHVYGRPTASVVDLDCDEDNYGNDDDSGVLEVYGLNTVSINPTGTPKANKNPTARLRPNAVGGTSNGNFSPAGYSPAIESKSVSYAARTKAGDSILKYKCKDSGYWDEIPENKQLVKISPSQGTEKMLGSAAPIKYMFQTTSNMATTLNTVLTDTGYDMVEDDDNREKEVQDLRLSSTEYCWYLGRIRNEEGRLSQRSTYLEGDMDVSGGHVVSLDLSDAEEYRLFPGQVVMIKGKNELGKCLRVSEILIPPALPLPEILPNTTAPLNIIVACGPYSPIDSFQYEPFKDLVEVIKRDKPHLCILMGPFIDPSHPMIADGEVADTFEDIFENMMKNLQQSLADLNTHLVLIPSSRDANHHQVYPTPPYSIDSRSKTSVYPDPSIFEVSGITIGVTSTDILKHLANSEIAKTTITDRMGGLSKMILSQRNLYPLYPPDESVPLDVQLWRKHCKFTSTPHILIMPSDLRYFIKDVDGTIIVNPERLTKGKSGGTYARLQVKLPEQIGDENTSSIADFCCGEIIKI